MPHPRFAALALLLVAAAAAQEISTSALINKELDQTVKLNINNVLPQAMEEIRRQTNVRMEAEPAVWELLPWGQDTNISAKIENKTLREALTLITRKLGLTYELKDEAVQIQPMPPLRRLARRSTVEELGALDFLASTPMEGLSSDHPTIKHLLEAVDKRLAELKPQYAIENRTTDALQQDKEVSVPRNSTMLEALEALPRQTGATWYPWGKSIVITTKEDRTRALLSRTMTVRYTGQDVLQVLMELSSRGGVRFDIQSGALQAVPTDARNIRALFENVSLLQILEAISGSTGLRYSVQADSVQIENPATRAASGVREPIVGLIQLDIGVQVLLPQSQVPPDLREFIKYKTQKELDKLRKMMEDEGFKPPATRPTTGPTGDEQL